MENFHASGVYTKQAHVKIPEGMYEEEHGRKGFFGRVSHLYHQHKPTGWNHILGDLKPRNLPPLFTEKALQNKFVKLLYNKDLEVYLGTLSQTPQNFFRNADYDEMFFIHEGEGRMETIYGHIPLHKGDYVIVPRGTTYKTYVKTPMKRAYHHLTGLYSFKMDYRTLFDWHPHYTCFYHQVSHHGSNELTDDPDEWVATSVLRKVAL